MVKRLIRESLFERNDKKRVRGLNFILIKCD